MKRDVVYERVLHRLMTEAKRAADFGKIVFSPNRTDGVPRDEPNTPSEADIEWILMNWVQTGSGINGESAAALSKLMSSGKYTDYFHGPKSGVLYRGLTEVPRVMLEKWVGEEVSNEGEVDVKWTSHSIGDSVATSWTTDIEVAENFAMWGMPMSKNRFSVVLEASARDNPGVFLDVGSILRTVAWSASTVEGESEALALGPVAVRKISWTS